ncbi:GlcG/HbpS family heme-binding protein [Nostoc sp.]|uniref:GlcG/HbpS family heme-binding protein n=1 Tax=Nostoc sp. TaxID=1180 RepID=UPI002FF6CC99
MKYLHQTVELSSAGALVVLHGAMTKAEEIGVPQCIVVVDRGGNLLVFVRMDGAKVLSQISATQKAVTAISSRVATGGMPEELALKLGITTAGQMTNLPGGLPIILDGQVVGAIGIGSGTGEQDVIVAQAGIDALSAAIAQGNEQHQ